jgi:hypothetical protein
MYCAIARNFDGMQSKVRTAFLIHQALHSVAYGFWPEACHTTSDAYALLWCLSNGAAQVGRCGESSPARSRSPPGTALVRCRCGGQFSRTSNRTGISGASGLTTSRDISVSYKGRSRKMGWAVSNSSVLAVDLHIAWEKPKDVILNWCNEAPPVMGKRAAAMQLRQARDP